MTKHPPAIKSEYQTLLEQAAGQQQRLRRPMTTDDVARVTASSLRLEGFETSAEDLKDRHGPSGE